MNRRCALCGENSGDFNACGDCRKKLENEREEDDEGEEQIDDECFVCPYCEHAHRGCDPFGYDYSNEKFRCDACEREFLAEVHTTLMFVTTPTDGETP